MRGDYDVHLVWDMHRAQLGESVHGMLLGYAQERRRSQDNALLSSDCPLRSRGAATPAILMPVVQQGVRNLHRECPSS